jgi:hypothetical protein
MDFEYDTEEFLRDVEVVRELGLPFPVLRSQRLDGSVPMSLTSVLSQSRLYPQSMDYDESEWRFFNHIFFDELEEYLLKDDTSNRSNAENLRDALRNMRDYPFWGRRFRLSRVEMQQAIEKGDHINSDVAKSQFRSLSIQSLSLRLQGAAYLRRTADSAKQLTRIFRIKDHRKGTEIETLGCRFSVGTSIPLRVFWSGAYRINWRHFGSSNPTATSYLQAGTYLFAVDGGIYVEPTPDINAIVQLPGNPFLQLNF